MLPTPDQVLGRAADHELDWPELIQRGLPQPERATPGLYALRTRSQLLYIGKSRDITRRLGQLVGALVGGWWLHSGGWRLFEKRQKNEMDVELTDLRLQVWEGDEPYRQESRVIRCCRPALNRTGPSRPPPDLDGLNVAAIFDGNTSDEDRLRLLDAVLERLILSVDRQRYAAEKDCWAMKGWHGVGARVGQRWKYTVYIGYRIVDGAVRVGLWAYEHDDLWYGDGEAEQEAVDQESLADMLLDWQSLWLDT